MTNGHDPNWNDPKIASFEAARRKAQAAKKKARGGGPFRNVGQIVFGAVLVAMAVGMLVWWGRSLFQSMSLAP